MSEIESLEGSLRSVLVQYVRAMEKLGWTMADVKPQETLDRLVREATRRDEALDAIEQELGTLPLSHLGPATERVVNKAWAIAREKRHDPELIP